MTIHAHIVTFVGMFHATFLHSFLRIFRIDIFSEILISFYTKIEKAI